MDEDKVLAEAPPIEPNPENLVCPECGSAEVECLDWVRMNDNFVIGGNESLSVGEYWCPVCEIHDRPVAAREYCEAAGHTATPCQVCGSGI